MLRSGRRLSALAVSQNELLVAMGGMFNQGEMVCATNTEGKAGVIADAQVQLVKPGMTACITEVTVTSASIVH